MLYAHPNLGEADQLRKELQKELEEQFEIQRKRSESVEAAQTAVRDKLKEVGTRIGAILDNPPWGADETPTRLMSEQRIRTLLSELADEFGVSIDATLDCSDALELALKLIQNASSAKNSKRAEIVASIKARIQELSVKIEKIRGAKQLEEVMFAPLKTELETAISEEFDSEVDRALPMVSGQLTNAFRRLTDHPAFDQLQVRRAQTLHEAQDLGSSIMPDVENSNQLAGWLRHTSTTLRGPPRSRGLWRLTIHGAAKANTTSPKNAESTVQKLLTHGSASPRKSGSA